MKLSDLFGSSEASFTPVLGSMQEAIAKVQQQKKDAATNCVVGFVDKFVAHRDRCLTALRDARKLEKSRKDALDMVERALSYFSETGNPMPIAFLCGQQYDISSQLQRLGIEVDSSTYEVPKDWQPTAAAK